MALTTQNVRFMVRCGHCLYVHYRRSQRKPDPIDHPSYEWFVGNKKRIYRKKTGKTDLPSHVVLDMAVNCHNGLPLIAKNGNDA